MSISAFIADGQEEKAFIKEIPGLWPDLRFSYRPATIDERREYQRDVAANVSEFVFKTALFLQGKVVSWSLSKPPTVDNIRKLRPRLFDRMVDIVFGDGLGDPDPLAEAKEAEERSKVQAQVANTGQAAGEVLLERKQGNS